MITLSKREAQALAVIASRLDRKPFSRRVTADDILDTITHLGMIQLDTISVVSRAHETAVWSRLGKYDPDLITTLFTDRNALTEYVTHAAAITPTAYLPLMQPVMDRYRASDDHWQYLPGIQPIARSVLERIQQEGALSSRDFEAPPDATRLGQWESWYGSKPERRAFAHLWNAGDLLISLRDRTFTRWYDLPERVAPDHWHREGPEPDHWADTILQHAIRSLGVSTIPWLKDYWRSGHRDWLTTPQIRQALDRLERLGQIVPVAIEGIDEAAWLDTGLLPAYDQLRSGRGWPTKTTLLSPFDNLIWNRPRMQQLWNMHYRLEIYTPAPRRVYGYYSMPILHRGQLVGRLDPSMNRRTGVLTIRQLHLEADVRPGEALAKAIARTLTDFVDFLGGDTWMIERSQPVSFAQTVQRHHP